MPINNKDFKYIYFGNSGSEILAKLVNILVKKSNNNFKIFIPAYFCGQSLKYLRSLDIKMEFYKLTEDLRPDYDYLEKFSFNKNQDAILLVHFFGRIVGQKEAENFAKSKEIYLIEDCAHIARFKSSQTWSGDFIFFSPHKHFLLPQIGLLFSKQELKIKNKEKIYEYLWYLKQFAKRMIFYRRKVRWGKIFNSQITEFKFVIPSSNLQNKALRLIQTNDKLYKEKLLFIFNKISKFPGWYPLINFNEEDTPYLIPMICDSKEIASRRFYLLNKKYQIVMQWPDLPVELKSLKSINEKIFRLVDTVIFFIIPNNHERIIKVLNNIQNDPSF